MTTANAAAVAAAHHTRLLDSLPKASTQPWAAQDLATGSAGIALAHIEQARSGRDNWRTAHAYILDATTTPVSEHDNTGLFLGAPALAFTLNAAAGTSTRYRTGLADLDASLARLVHRRIRNALERIRVAQPTTFAEYDVVSGLSGIGAVLLRRAPGSSALEQTLTYLVALTRPLRLRGEILPGWWVGHDPHRKNPPAFPGHANLGLAHGITGPLALLARAARAGITVDGQHQAITDICDWLDNRVHGDDRPWWPEHVAINELRSGNTAQQGPSRPSWCYGTPGIARASQLAAIALGDRQRQHAYEEALLACVDDHEQLSQLTEPGLCHGWAGAYQTIWRAAADASTPELRTRLPRLAEHLLAAAEAPHDHGPGFLNGIAGIALALHTAATDSPPNSGWDACLLIN